tara:strand:- start:1026 stop:4853 length:3828 start_codon:yes stop_codon:yes gene_type:complete
MLANYKTQSFQETRKKLLEAQNKGELQDKEAIKKFLNNRDFDYTDFKNEELRYQKDIQETGGKLDKTPGYTPTRILGRAVGDAVRGVSDFVEAVAPETFERFNEYASGLGEKLPVSFQKQLGAVFDPYHGDLGVGSTIEKVTGQIGSYLVPFVGITKATKLARFAPGARSVVSRTARKLSSKQRKVGKILGGATAFGASATLVEDPQENIVNTLTQQFPESLSYLEKLAVDPTDKKSKQYLDAFINNLTAEGVIGGALITTGQLVKAFKNVKDRIPIEFSTTMKDLVLGSPGTKRRRFLQRTAAGLSSRMGTDDKTLASIIKRDKAAADAALKADGLANDFLKVFSKEFNKKKQSGILNVDETEYIENVVNQALRKGKVIGSEEDALTRLQSDLPRASKFIQRMRTNLDTLSQSISNKLPENSSFRQAIDKNIGLYVNTSYKIFDDPKYRNQILKRLDKFTPGDDDNVIANALSYVSRKMGITDINAQKEALEDLLDNNQVAKELDKFGDKPFFNLSGSSKVTRSKRLNDDALKALYGEIKDPFKNYTNTFEKLSLLKSEQDFLNDVAGDLVRRDIAKVSPTTKQIKTQDLVSLEDVAKERLSKIFGKNLVEQKKMALLDKDLNKIVATITKKPQLTNPAEKVYVTKEYRDAIRDGLDQYVFSSLSPDARVFGISLRGLVDTFARWKGFSQVAKTVYSPSTHGRNIFGSAMILAANGMLTTPAATKETFKTIYGKLGGLSTRKFNEKIARYGELGITDTGVGLGVIKSNLKKFNDNPTKWLESTTVGKANDSTLDKVFANRKMLNVYQAEDDFFKIMHFEKTKDQFKKAFPNANKTQIEEMAAARTRDLMPNYALVPKYFKSLRSMPVGDFLSFPAEMMRVTKNLMKYTLKDLGSGNLELQKAAAKRLAGMTAVGMGGDYLKNKSMQLMGIGEDEDQAINNLVPSYQSDYARIYASPVRKNKDGKFIVDYMNLGPMDPFEYIKSAARRTHEYINDSDFSNLDSAIDDTGSYMIDVFEKQLEPFFGPSMILENFSKMKVNPDAADTPAIEYGKAIGSALATSLVPGFASYLNRVNEYYTTQAERGEGRELYSKGYRSIPEGDVDLLAAIGARRERFDISSSIDYNLNKVLRDYNYPDKDYKKLIDQGVGKTVGPFGTDLNIPFMKGPVTSKQIYDKFKEAQENRKASMEELRALLADYGDLGLNLQDLKDAYELYGLRKRKLGGKTLDAIQGAINNTFIPVEVEESTMNKYLSRTQRVPYREMDDLSRRLEGVRID